MAKGTRKKPTKKPPAAPLRRRIARMALRVGAGLVAFMLALVVLFAVINPPMTFYMWQESRYLGEIEHEWVDFDDIAPVMARSVVAAEDANFCHHWGFDMDAIRTALDQGSRRGASTLSQQTVKNVYLWHGRSWPRKAAEALITPVVETIWSKRRILEVYMNIAEFDEGVFGVGAAARHYFGTTPDALTPRQAALLAAVLPNPKGRSAARPDDFTARRATSIIDGAATILADGRAACFG